MVQADRSRVSSAVYSLKQIVSEKKNACGDIGHEVEGIININPCNQQQHYHHRYRHNHQHHRRNVHLSDNIHVPRLQRLERRRGVGGMRFEAAGQKLYGEADVKK